MEPINRNDLMFYITKDMIQEEVIKLGVLEMDSTELLEVKDLIEWGITTDLDTITSTAIETVLNRRIKEQP